MAQHLIRQSQIFKACEEDIISMLYEPSHRHHVGLGIASHADEIGKVVTARILYRTVEQEKGIDIA